MVLSYFFFTSSSTSSLELEMTSVVRLLCLCITLRRRRGSSMPSMMFAVRIASLIKRARYSLNAVCILTAA